MPTSADDADEPNGRWFRRRGQGGRRGGVSVENRKIATQKIETRFEQGESVRVEFKGEEGGPPAHPGG